MVVYYRTAIVLYYQLNNITSTLDLPFIIESTLASHGMEAMHSVILWMTAQVPLPCIVISPAIPNITLVLLVVYVATVVNSRSHVDVPVHSLLV